MKLGYYGAADTVTGSKFLLDNGQTKVLVDCGLFQGVRLLRRRNWNAPAFDPRSLQAVLLTHAHLDHSGYLPVLAREGFQGPIYCTEGTEALTKIILRDAAHIQEEEAAYANRRGFSRHDPAVPLFTATDVERVLPMLEVIEFDETTTVRELEVEFRPAGHILGAASVVVKAAGLSVEFSGDLGRGDDLVMRPPANPAAVSHLVMESTYGDRQHPDVDPVEALGEIAKRTFERGGVLVIPAFAVGRAQALLHAFVKVFERGLAPVVPLFLNSPMATSVTKLYLKSHRDHRLSEKDCRAMDDLAQYVNSPDDSRALNRRPGPMVIVSASGMLTGGRVLHHVRQFGPDPKNTILLSGYQAPGTRGGALAAGAQSLRIHGMEVDIRAEVAQIDTLSAHADGDDLLQWLQKAPHPPSTVHLVHGERGPVDVLRQRIERELGLKVRVPEHGEIVTL